MRRVSLILPVATPSAISHEFVERCRSGLRGAGYEVEVLAVLDSAEPPPEGPADRSWSWVRADRPGLASSVMTGLSKAQGDVLLVLDPTQGYLADDLARVAEPVAAGRADLVVARRDRAGAAPAGRAAVVDRAGRLAGRLTRPVLGASDPLAGLLAMTPALVCSVAGTFVPVGSRFTLDLLLRARGRKEEVLVRTEAPAAPLSLGIDDLRHIKRLADDRYGNISRLLQFCAVGASGMVVDLTTYALLQLVFSRTWLAQRTAPLVGGPLDLAVAGALAITVALTWNFSLNRRLTFSYARFGSIFRQYFTYAMSNAAGIALSLSLRLYLPEHFGFFHRHRLAAAVVGIVAATGVSFSLARWVVFSHRSGPREKSPPDDRDPAPDVVETTAARSFGV
jgi:dolichol-phosphate mannosyltransferase